MSVPQTTLADCRVKLKVFNTPASMLYLVIPEDPGVILNGTFEHNALCYSIFAFTISTFVKLVGIDRD